MNYILIFFGRKILNYITDCQTNSFFPGILERSKFRPCKVEIVVFIAVSESVHSSTVNKINCRFATFGKPLKKVHHATRHDPRACQYYCIDNVSCCLKYQLFNSNIHIVIFWCNSNTLGAYKPRLNLFWFKRERWQNLSLIHFGETTS